GGSFGGKDDIINMMACRVALLCRKTQRPVKLTNSREISMRESYKRHPYIMKYKVGFNNDGRIIAMQIEILADSGAYSSQSFFVTWRSVVQATGPYTIPHVRTDIRAVYTNNSYTAAFRGFGSPQIIFAQESLMDEIAALCNISPLQIRKINGLKNGSITATGQKLSGHAVSLRQVITQAAGEADYSLKVKKYQKLNSNNGRYRYGIGLACSLRGCSLGAEGTDASSAIVSVQADGSVYLLTALNENGQGLRTTFSMIVAEVLGISLHRIVFVEPATAAIADGGPTVASRSTLMGGNAVMDAALQVKKAIFQAIRPELKVRKLSETCWKDDKIIKITAGEKSESAINFETAVSRAIRAGTNLSAYGWYHAPAVDWEESSGQGKAYFTYVYGCQVAETILDTSTGKLEIIRITAAHDAGTIINRSGAEGQVYGGVVQGLGYGIMEDFSLIEGRLATANFDEYLIPTIKDVPTIKPVFVENPDKNGPYGAKSLGEPTLELTAAAINNALAFATGKRSYEIPLSLEQVYLGSNLQKPSRQSESRNIRTSKQILPYLPGVDIITPSGIDKAFQMLATGGFQILAGGTDLIIQARKVTPARKLLNLGSIKELQFIKEEPGSVHIGAMTTFTQILENPLLRRYYPVLLEAVRKIGSQQIRNRATIGGNIVNAAPCADSLPPLLIYNSRLKLQSLQGIRMVPVVDFTLDAYETMIRKDEILIAIEIPKPADHYFHSYFQLGRRNAVNITRMSVAGVMSFRSDKKVRDCRLACGSVFSRPCRLERVENAMIGNILSTDKISQLEQTLKSDTEAEIGSRWSSPYKIPVFANMVRDVFMDMLSQFKDQQCY
ncbi:MAG: molybdopterin-dependent oxidoreductase, partial [Candidatus Cloacimonetes bacterium]|nr:molybdopterin-dependent oxidoreductase [Candidatus Cloacimonadota bacterium]